jgi:tetratricopeptide (TPR) repeat protein
MGNYGEAAKSYRNAYKLKRNIATYQGLIDSYIKLDLLNEATSTAKEALLLLPSSSRTLCLAGLVMFHSPLLTKKVILANKVKCVF